MQVSCISLVCLSQEGVVHQINPGHPRVTLQGTFQVWLDENVNFSVKNFFFLNISSEFDFFF